MKTLCLLTNAFPYGTWEAYLETEVKFYKDFSHIYIFSLQVRPEQLDKVRHVGENVTIIPVVKVSNMTYLLNAVRVLGNIDLYKEIARLAKGNRLSFVNIVKLFVYLSRSNYEARRIDEAMKGTSLKDVVFYSYRFEYQPYVAMLLKDMWKLDAPIIARAHGYDLYESEHKGGYIPLRVKLLQSLAKVFPCSGYGTRYLQELFPAYADKVEPRFLGTLDRGVKVFNGADDVIRLVSCSNVVPVKRLEYIVRALSSIKDKTIEWTHYGDGPLKAEVQALAKELLPSNITAVFKGHIENKDLLEAYKSENYYAFINVSSSEGIPVSIMEANSFGIPCIATNVGGTGEMLEHEKNGLLLSADATVDEIAGAIEQFCTLEATRYEEYRQVTRRMWEAKFWADRSYEAFVDELQSS